MSKSLLYRWLGVGSVPTEAWENLHADGILASDEGMRTWMVARRLRGPGKRIRLRAVGFTGALVVTRRRIVCFGYGRTQFDLSLETVHVSCLFVSVPRKGRLWISFETSHFWKGWSGVVQFRFRTAQWDRFREILLAKGVQEGVAA